MNVSIHTDYITLAGLLKLSGLCGTGGESKEAVMSGKVLVNGEVCVQRGRKIREGDTVSAFGEKISVCREMGI